MENNTDQQLREKIMRILTLRKSKYVTTEQLFNLFNDFLSRRDLTIVSLTDTVNKLESEVEFYKSHIHNKETKEFVRQFHQCAMENQELKWQVGQRDNEVDQRGYKIEEQDKEIERLKGLIPHSFLPILEENYEASKKIDWLGIEAKANVLETYEDLIALYKSQTNRVPLYTPDQVREMLGECWDESNESMLIHAKIVTLNDTQTIDWNEVRTDIDKQTTINNLLGKP